MMFDFFSIIIIIITIVDTQTRLGTLVCCRVCHFAALVIIIDLIPSKIYWKGQNNIIYVGTS